MKQNRWILLPFLLVVLFITNLSLGSVTIPFPDVINILLGKEVAEAVWKDIVLNFRMTKALTCILAGGALSISGLQMQTLFRNPLAGPDVLGLSSGASLAVSFIFMGNAAGIGLLTGSGPWTVAIAASLGCTVIFILMLIISRRVHDNVSLLIVGLMVAAGMSSVVSVLQYITRAEQLQTYVIWTFGNVGGLNWPEIRVLFTLLGVGSVISFALAKPLNTLLLGDNYARSMGIDIKKSRLLIILSTSILTGAVTAFCGPIAFVGLAVPHLTKLLIRTQNHKVLIPAVILGGSILMLFCDTIAHARGSTQILPINAITALIGAPVVIWVIMRNRVIQ